MIPNLRVIAFTALALGTAPAYAQSYADDVCRDLRAERPEIIAPIVVVGHQPITVGGKIRDRKSHWICPPKTASAANLPAVDAETVVPEDVRSVFQCQGEAWEEGCRLKR